jgi:hypothetical protein
MNSWDDNNFVAAVEKSGRHVLEENFALPPDETRKLPRHQQFVVPKEGPEP